MPKPMSDMMKRWIAAELLEYAREQQTSPITVFNDEKVQAAFLVHLSNQGAVTKEMLTQSRDMAVYLARRQNIKFDVPPRPKNTQQGVRTNQKRPEVQDHANQQLESVGPLRLTL
jgi:hypothetical protein